jgi:dTDP-glucose 4,6-dehydratase
VYGTLGETGLFTETTPYAPNPPYAASKAGADFIVRSYFHTFGLNATISNCSNNYGPRQHAEKLIPTVIRKAFSGQPIPIYGDGKNIRDWLHVEDHCVALTTIHARGQAGETYNIGSRNEQDNNAIAKLLCELLDEQHPQGAPHARHISYVKDRPGHDRRYAIDPSKIEAALGWRPQHDFTMGLRDTVAWYVAQHRATKHG